MSFTPRQKLLARCTKHISRCSGTAARLQRFQTRSDRVAEITAPRFAGPPGADFLGTMLSPQWLQFAHGTSGEMTARGAGPFADFGPGVRIERMRRIL